MAELLVKAINAWGDDKTRSMKGDIIVVRSDGWVWGKEESPPRFVIIKLPKVKEEDVKHYEQSLMDNTDPQKPIMLKRRKYAIDTVTVDDCVKEIKGVKEIAKASFDSKLITKVL